MPPPSRARPPYRPCPRGLYGARAGAAAGAPGRPTGAGPQGRGAPCGRFRRGRVSTSSAPRSERRAAPSRCGPRTPRGVRCCSSRRSARGANGSPEAGSRRAAHPRAREWPGTPGGSLQWHTPVLLAAAFLLPPPAAALVALPGGAADPGRAAAAVAAPGVAGRAARSRGVGRLVGALGAGRAGRGPLVRLPVRPRDRRCGRRRVLPGADRARRGNPGARRAGAGTGRLARPLPPLASARRRARARRADDGGALAQSVRAGRRAARAVADVRVVVGVRAVPAGNGPPTRRPSGHSCRPSTSRTGTRAGTASGWGRRR